MGKSGSNSCSINHSNQTHAHWSMSICLSTLVQATTSLPQGVPTNILLGPDNVSILHRGLLFILQDIHLRSGFESFHTMCMYIEALPTRQFDGSGFNNLSSRRDDVLLQTQQGTWYYGATHEVLWRKSCYFLPSNMKPENKEQTAGENNPWKDYSNFQVPASDFQGPTPGSGPCLRLPGSYCRGQGPASSFRFPASRPSDFFCLRINGNLS